MARPEAVTASAATRTALVWRHGLPDWTEATRIPEIAALLPPPLPPGGKAPRPAFTPAFPAEAEARGETPTETAGSRRDEIRKKLETDANPRRYAQVAEDLTIGGFIRDDGYGGAVTGRTELPTPLDPTAKPARCRWRDS